VALVIIFQQLERKQQASCERFTMDGDPQQNIVFNGAVGREQLRLTGE
jgi:hypothetical protein